MIAAESPARGKFAVQRLDPILLLVTGLSVLVLFSRFLFGEGFLAYYHDDFFYYLKIATNLLDHKGLSFDGVHRTNGFHPLYLLFVVLLQAVAPGKLFFVLLQTFITLSIISTYSLADSILARFTRQILLRRISAACIAYFALVITRGGMEIVLTIPLACCLIWFLTNKTPPWSANQYLVCALLISAVVLSRLDSALLILLLLLFAGPTARRDLNGKRVLFFLGGLLPLFLYALANLYWFQSLMPVSGQAKQLRTSYFPSAVPLRSVLLDGFSPTRTPFTVFACVALFAGLACLWMERSKIAGRGRGVLLALLLFPLLHLAFYSVVSDWGFFPWYFYALVLSSIAAGATVLASVDRWNQQRVAVAAHLLSWTLAVALLVFSILLVRSQKPSDRDVYANARDIQAFAKYHDGTYAMGDRAGYVGYLIQQPVIQLEGLVEDREYLEKLRKKEPLRAILGDYRVNYYIGANPVRNHQCYTMTEPLQGGPTAYRVHGTFCQEPLATFHHGDYETAIFATSAQ